MSVRCRLIVCAACLLGWATAAQDNVSAADRGRLLFLGVAYDEAPPEGFDSGSFNWAPDNVSRILRLQSEKLFRNIEVENVKGEQATHQAIMRALRQMKRHAKADDLFFLYWGTHGGSGPDGWSANLPGGGVMYGSELKQELGEFPCPVVCLLSTCGSGGFAGARADQVEVPPNVTAFCACRRKQSTSNELDRAFCEAIAGFADADGNGEVTIGETLQYVPRRYRQMFRGGEPTDVDLLPVLAASDATPRERALSLCGGDSLAAVAQNGAWYGCRVLEKTPDGTKVRFFGFDATTENGGYSMPDAVVSDDVIDLLGGDPTIDVEWEGSWYPARVLERSRNQWKIHYIGYPDSDDEEVPRSRVRFTFLPPSSDG